MARKKIYAWTIGILVVVVFTFLLIPKTESYPALKNFDGKTNLYKDLTCGCCGVYSGYMDNALDLEVKEGVDRIKQEYGVPEALRSCHTTIVGDYFVEGHIPLEAINKLIEEKPDIAGIALPGMPSGTPGMPGTKSGDWIIYAVNHDGTHFEFMRI